MSLRTLLDNEIIHIKVGKDAMQFTIHKGLLQKSSHFFTAACSEAWKKEAPHDDNQIILAEDSSQVFDIFRTYLYQGRILKPDTTPEESNVIENTTLADCYFFADRIGCDGFKSVIYTRYQQLLFAGPKIGPSGVSSLEWEYLPAAVAHIWNNTLPGTSLRRLWIEKFNQDVFAGTGIPKHPDETFLEKWDLWPPEFLQDCFRSLAELSAESIGKAKKEENFTVGESCSVRRCCGYQAPGPSALMHTPGR